MFVKANLSKIFLLLAVVCFSLAVFDVTTGEANANINNSVPTCYICDYYGCELAGHNQAGGTDCAGGSSGYCVLHGSCCNAGCFPHPEI